MKPYTKIFFIFVITTSLFSSVKVPMKELTNPLYITTDNSQIYILEDCTVYIYSLKGIKFKKKFGGEGEGPGEFKIRSDRPLTLSVLANDLVVSSFGRFSYFSKEGIFKTEAKTESVYTMAAKDFGDQFVGIGGLEEDKKYFLTLNIYDKRLNKQKELLRVEEELQFKGKKFFYCHLHFPVSIATSFITYQDKVYVTWGKDDSIKIFDKAGKKISFIPLKLKKIKLTQDYKENVAYHFKNDRKLPQPIYERYYKNILFPKFFPAIRDMCISDGKIYVVTYLKEKELTKTEIFDLKGKQIKTVFLPIKEMDAVALYPFTIKNKKLYQLIEDPNGENWNLHRTSIR